MNLFPLCLEIVSSLLYQLNSSGSLCFSLSFSTILTVLQFSRNIRMLISLLCCGWLCVYEKYAWVYGCCCITDHFVCAWMHTETEDWICLLMCVCQSQHALIQYSNTPMVLLHQGNIKTSSITASPCFTNCSILHRLRARRVIRRGEIPFRTTKWTQTPAWHSATLCFHKAWYLMHRCGSRQWWTGRKTEGDMWLEECEAVKDRPTSVRHVSGEEREREGERQVGKVRAARSAKVTR